MKPRWEETIFSDSRSETMSSDIPPGESITVSLRANAATSAFLFACSATRSAPQQQT
eukprot:m.145876 g.145876  ORF g.145876 m.145876 type:complete len:57 (-) comp52694_c0_seq9:533-703(-)